MEIRHIKYFIQVYHDLNITKASKSLFISQQALSKAIVNLEEEIGCPLFERSVSGLTATRYADNYMVIFVMPCHPLTALLKLFRM